ncbi:MAG: hypothetical protein CMB99_00700 [Flavobacteriaceae bacterium]|nr:hypothetical protein [Flavobacteriaceae bacterium]|tara:strand:- start:150 stop:722 length:573 start_codon:yes stop_codon:yes gene_type:complete
MKIIVGKNMRSDAVVGSGFRGLEYPVSVSVTNHSMTPISAPRMGLALKPLTHKECTAVVLCPSVQVLTETVLNWKELAELKGSEHFATIELKKDEDGIKTDDAPGDEETGEAAQDGDSETDETTDNAGEKAAESDGGDKSGDVGNEKSAESESDDASADADDSSKTTEKTEKPKAKAAPKRRASTKAKTN